MTASREFFTAFQRVKVRRTLTRGKKGEEKAKRKRDYETKTFVVVVVIVADINRETLGSSVTSNSSKQPLISHQVTLVKKASSLRGERGVRFKFTSK